MRTTMAPRHRSPVRGVSFLCLIFCILVYNCHTDLYIHYEQTVKNFIGYHHPVYCLHTELPGAKSRSGAEACLCRSCVRRRCRPGDHLEPKREGLVDVL